MGRKAGQIAFYYWMSKSTGSRVGWLHPSVKAAEAWRDSKYWKYAENQDLESYLDTVSPSRAIKEEELWLAHQRGYKDIVLKRGVGIYV